jgi:hypothetical protein
MGSLFVVSVSRRRDRPAARLQAGVLPGARFASCAHAVPVSQRITHPQSCRTTRDRSMPLRVQCRRFGVEVDTRRRMEGSLGRRLELPQTGRSLHGPRRGRFGACPCSYNASGDRAVRLPDVYPWMRVAVLDRGPAVRQYLIFSFSVYLVHIFVLGCLTVAIDSVHINTGDWLPRLGASAAYLPLVPVTAYLTCRFVERPTHEFARRHGHEFTSRTHAWLGLGRSLA